MDLFFIVHWITLPAALQKKNQILANVDQSL